MDTHQNVAEHGIATTSNDISRMRHEVDEKDLLKLLKNLSLQEQTNLCTEDIFFKDFIGSEMIAKNWIDFGFIDEKMPDGEVVLKQSAIDQFKTFGKFMNRFTVCGHDLDLFLDAIAKYCSPDTFTEVHLSFHSTKDKKLLNQSLPYFSKIRNLRLFDATANGVFQHFLTLLSNGPSASSLQTLQLQQVNITGDWLHNMQNLNAITINGPRSISMDDLASWLIMRPKLSTFQYNGSIDISEIFETLSECCPHLETFSDCHSTDMKGCLNNGKRTDRYTFLSVLSQLTNVTLTSYSETGSDVSEISALLNIPKLDIFDNWKRLVYKVDDFMSRSNQLIYDELIRQDKPIETMTHTFVLHME